MQPSMFNVRVPLEDQNEVFLMNTFTDAQLIVSSDVAALLDRTRAREAGRLDAATSATPSARSPSTASSSRAATPIATDLTALLPRGAREHRAAAHDGADHAAVQLRLRLLHPGGSRRLQQARREDVARDRGAGRRLGRAAARRAAPRELRADVLRRRAAAEPAGDVLPRRADVAGLRGARRPHADQHHHQRPAAHAARSSIGCNRCGLNGIKITLDGDRDTHNQMRPLRGGQGTFDKIIANVRAGRATRPASPSAATSTWRPPTAIPALLDFLQGAGLRRQARRRWHSSRSSASQGAAGAGRDSAMKGSKFIALTAVSDKPLGGACMTSAGAGAGRASGCDTLQHSRRSDGRSCARRRRSAGSRPSTASTWGRARSTAGTPTPSAPTARSTPARASPATRTQSAGHIDGRQEAWRSAGGRALRSAVGLAGVPRLRVHPRLRRRLHGRRLQRARHRQQTQLPQDQPFRPASYRSRTRQRPSARPPSTSRSPPVTTRFRRDTMKNDKKQDKKNGTLRPWLVDVVVDDLR